MTFRPRKIALELAEPDMELAVAVLNQQGGILLQAGCKLTASAICSLRKRGVGHVSVLMKDDRSEAELAIERDRVTNRLNILFRHAGADTYLNSLHKQVLDYRLSKLL